MSYRETGDLDAQPAATIGHCSAFGDAAAGVGCGGYLFVGVPFRPRFAASAVWWLQRPSLGRLARAGADSSWWTIAARHAGAASGIGRRRVGEHRVGAVSDRGTSRAGHTRRL